MSEKLQALVAGCGNIGGGLNKSKNDSAVMTHALAYLRDERFALAACVDPDETVRREFMARWSVSKGFATVGEALSSGMKFDVASVAAPTKMHIPVLQELLASPVRAVLAEKPLGGSYASALQVVDAYEKKNKPLLVCFLRRFDPAMHKLRQEISEGKWGALQSATLHYSRGAMNNGSHAADLLSFLTGETEFKLVSTGRKIYDGVDGDPTVDAVMTLGNATIHFLAADGRNYATFEIVLTFEKGVVALEENGFVCRRKPAAASSILPGIQLLSEGTAEKTGLDTAFLRALDALFNVIHSNENAPSTGRTALPAIQICELIRQSATRG